MKLDTTSYYPKSPLDDDEPESATRPEHEEHSTEPEVSRPDSSPAEAEERRPDLPPTAGESFVTSLSHILSWVFVPMMMPVYGAALCFGISILAFTPFNVRLAFIAIIAAFNVAIPAVVVLLLKKAGYIQDIGLNNRQERFVPYMVCIACLVGTAIFLHFKGAPHWFCLFFYGGAATGLAEVIINRWWKISVHSAGMAGIVGLLLHLMMYEYTTSSAIVWLMITLGFAGLLGAARIWLGRHTLAQVLAGYAVGFCGVFFIMMIR